MKTLLMLMVFTLLVACTHDVPLSREHLIAIDRNLVGAWERIPGEGEPVKTGEYLSILPFSDTEYLVTHIDSHSRIYFRAYAIELHGLEMVQMEFLGSDGDASDREDNTRYLVAKCAVTNGLLSTTFLNDAVVANTYKTSSELAAAVGDVLDHDELFADAMSWKKVDKQQLREQD